MSFIFSILFSPIDSGILPVCFPNYSQCNLFKMQIWSCHPCFKQPGDVYCSLVRQGSLTRLTLMPSLHILSVTKCSVMLGTQSHALLSTIGLCSHCILLLGCTFSTTQSSMGNFLFFSLSSLLFKLLKNNTFTGDLENTEQSYIWFHYILRLFFK